VDDPGTGTPPPADGQPPGPSPAQAAAAAAARQAVAYRLLGAACALVGVLLVVGGLLALRGKPATSPPAAAPTSTATRATTSANTLTTAVPRPTTPAPAPTTRPPTTPPRTTVPPATTPAPTTPAPTTRPPTARAPLTVLNNTTTPHLADMAAARFRAGGWQVAKVGNFTGEIPQTTVYYTPGNAAEQRAAQALADQYSGISRVLPRYAGLPDSVHGVIVVLAPDWS
jgi:hypothetical protein